jgi:hypothetical protein
MELNPGDIPFILMKEGGRHDSHPAWLVTRNTFRILTWWEVITRKPIMIAWCLPRADMAQGGIVCVRERVCVCVCVCVCV